MTKIWENFKGLMKIEPFYISKVSDNFYLLEPLIIVENSPGDITKKADIQDFFKKVRNAFGSFDILVNCAGILKDNDVEQTFLVNSVS